MLLKVDCYICRGISLDSASATPCGHIFHSSCLRTWMKRKTSCPVCHRAIRPEEIITKLHVTVLPSNKLASSHSESGFPSLLGLCMGLFCGVVLWKCELPGGKTLSDIVSKLQNLRLLMFLDHTEVYSTFGNLIVFDKDNILNSGLKALLRPV